MYYRHKVKEAKEKIAPQREAVLFLLYADGKFLLEERVNPTKSYFGYTKVPGGKVEEGESRQAALEREVEEEVGVKLKEIVFLDSFESVTTDGVHYLVHAYLLPSFDGEIEGKEEENSNFVWFSYHQAMEKVRFADSKYALLLAGRFVNEAGQGRG